MRVVAILLLIAMLLPLAASAMETSATSACCCTVKAGATCPMKRKADTCAKAALASCGLRSSEAARFPMAKEPQPALLLATGTQDVAQAAMRFDSIAEHPATAALRPPLPPPPKQV